MYASDSHVQCLHLNESHNLLSVVVLFLPTYTMLLVSSFQSFFRFLFVYYFLYYFFSCRPCNVRLVTLKDLLGANADPNIADSAGRSALSWAVTNPSGMSPSALCGVVIKYTFLKFLQLIDAVYYDLHHAVRNPGNE